MKNILIAISLFTFYLQGSVYVPCMPVERVTLKPYNSLWAIMHRNEAKKLSEALGNKRVKDIQHFGSTSIPGMIAKPIIDIIIGLDEFRLEKGEVETLRAHGYELIEKSPYCERFYFHKRGECSINLSVTTFKSPTWNACIDVRDYLLNHPREREDYMSVKLRAIMEGNIYIGQYSRYKSEFIKKLNERARSWRSDE